MMSMTPMMQQYVDVKKDYPDCILFFRLGDFYEMFFEDALIGSKAMEITLTGKSCGLEERAPMCGVPYHAADSYIAKLIDKGYKVAICEQMEDPAAAKGIVRREVVRIVTPGTVLSQTMLNEKENNYLISTCFTEAAIGLSYCDLSTGEIGATEISGNNRYERLQNELVKLSAKEILTNLPKEDEEALADLAMLSAACLSPLAPHYFDENKAEGSIKRQFAVSSLQGLGLGGIPAATKALGALLSYLFETQKQQLSHLQNLKVFDLSSRMSLDKATIRNLELTETLYEKKTQGSLLGILDKTLTAMGSRRLKQWLREPLTSMQAICERLDAVETLTEELLLRNNIREALRQIYDLERLIGRVACGNANGRDLISLRNSIRVLPDIKAELADSGNKLLISKNNQINDLTAISELISRALVEEPPFTIKEGGLIREAYSAELDSLKHSIKDGQLWIAGLEAEERTRTGIKNIKVGYNKVFGYYIEITRSNYAQIPENYIRKQTLANCERFITPELKEVESVVLNAEAKINQLEYELFQTLREMIQEEISVIQSTAAAISEVDVLASFAEVSSRFAYVKPKMTLSNAILIEKGRHPVLEQMVKDGVFVSNDTYLDNEEQSLLLITGPNMSGKSTYMRQTALIVLMAQTGCFVPAEAANIGIVDRIYTRIGASDNLAQGQSTFFVEMSELAYILNTSTEKSLVILDEIGRGTSTYDGLSIAWAVVEYLCRSDRKIRTLFATHYHELTALEGAIRGLKNFNVDVSEQNGNIVFLHKIVEGSASRSYGIHVAKLAGVPNEVLTTANEKLGELEAGNAVIELLPKESRKQTPKENKDPAQVSFFDFFSDPIIERLKALDLMEITPSMAIGILEELKNAATK
ncbi:MAG: DNA mismatch repair protein MutS [Eubacteriales bacterium]|nr:DNA mismatch repair protein MutS [Eubacteriales bacterium]